MARFLFDAGIVRPGIGRVDGNHSRRDAFHMEPGAHVFQLFAVLPAFGAEIGRHVFRGNQCCAHTWARLTNVEGLDEAARQLDIRDQFGAPDVDPHRPFGARDGLVELGHMGRFPDLRQHDDVRRPRHDVSQVFSSTIDKRVDAHARYDAAFLPCGEDRRCNGPRGRTAGPAR